MESQQLYRVNKSDFEQLDKLLTSCFAKDPLYLKLIPDEDTRKRLMPELFECDLEEFFSTCDIYADSEEMNGVLVVSDESEAYNPFTYYLTEALALLKTDGLLLKEDHTLKTFLNFVKGKEYLDSSWTDQLPPHNRIHIIYLAVSPEKQHHGISTKLMHAVGEYARANKLMISLETHNPENVAMYEHYGFKVFGIVEKIPGLKQYCMIKEI